MIDDVSGKDQKQLGKQLQVRQSRDQRHATLRLPPWRPFLLIAAFPYALSLPLVWPKLAPRTDLALIALLLALLCLWVSVVDLRLFLIPDPASLALAVSGLGVTLSLNPELISLHLLGGVGGYGFLRGLDLLYRRWRRQAGLGQGDAKLLAAAGLWVGPAGLSSLLLWAGLLALGVVTLGSLLGRRRRRRWSRRVAFGPYLAFGLWLVWLLGPLG